MSSESSRNRLPFEPKQKKTKTPKKSPVATTKAPEAPDPKSNTRKAKSNAIPEVVSKRMIRRMAFFCGIPTVLGISSFFSSYWVVSHDWFTLPTYAVLLVSMGFFGLGVVGLSYGILSASWEENRVGSWFGWEEFSLNFGRMTSAWRSARQEARGK